MTQELTVADLADVIRAPLDSVRGWIARSPERYAGKSDGYRLWFSSQDAFYYALLRDLIWHGVGARSAMHHASETADGAFDGEPTGYLIATVTRSGNSAIIGRRRRNELVDGLDRSALIIPLGAVWKEVNRRAGTKEKIDEPTH